MVSPHRVPQKGEGEHQGAMFSGLFGQPVNFIRRQVDVAAGRLSGKIPDGPRGIDRQAVGLTASFNRPDQHPVGPVDGSCAPPAATMPVIHASMPGTSISATLTAAHLGLTCTR